MNKIKKILIIVTCFCFSFVFLFSINFARSNIVKADYNLVNVADHLHEVQENYVDVKYGLVLLPNTEYKVSFDYDVISTNAVELKATIGYGELAFSYDIVNANTFYPNLTSGTITVTFITPATFEVENPILWVREARSSTTHTSTVQISNIVVHFANEALGTAYEQGFINGSQSPVSIWQDIVIDDDLLNSHWYFSELPMYRTSTQFTGGGIRSSVFFNLPIGYYRITQKNLPDYFRQGYPSLHPASRLMGSHVAPLVYTTDDFFYWAVDIVGDYDTDRYVYFSVDSSEKRYSFQLACPIDALFIGNWNDSFTSLSQIITLSVDLAGNEHYRNGYQDGYNSGATSGYIDGETDGLSQGFLNGYDDGYNDGFKEGDNAGYAEGYDYGYNVGASGTITTNWFTSFLSSTFDILNIEIFPNIKLVYLIFIPVGLGVLALVLKMARG